MDGNQRRGGVERAAPLIDVCMKGENVSPDFLQNNPFKSVSKISGANEVSPAISPPGFAGSGALPPHARNGVDRSGTAPPIRTVALRRTARFTSSGTTATAPSTRRVPRWTSW
jgi:hypothetical protein